MHAWLAIEHDKEWGSVFAGRIQHIVEEMAQGCGSNAFSRFVYQETLRCLSSKPALRLPGAQASHAPAQLVPFD